MTFFFSLIDFQIPVVVSTKIAKAMRIRMPEIGRKKENEIDISCSL